MKSANAYGATKERMFNGRGAVTQLKLEEARGQYDENDYIINYEYAANGVDLKKVSRGWEGVNKVLLEVVYSGQRDVSSVTNALGQVTTVSWHSNGLVERVIDQGTGDVVQFTYDNNWRPADTLVNGQVVESATLDERGRVLAVADANGDLTSFSYDDLNRVTEVSSPDGTILRNGWSCCSLDEVQLLTQDGTGEKLLRRVIYERDGRGEVTEVVDSAGRHLKMAYDQAGRMTQLTDAAGNITQWVYNRAGQLEEEIYADSSQESWTWEYGQLKTYTNRRGARLYLFV